jgi:hypothetical protein
MQEVWSRQGDRAHALAKILGWEATLDTVASRLRCSRCHRRGQCELTAQSQRKPCGVRLLTDRLSPATCPGLAFISRCPCWSNGHHMLHTQTSARRLCARQIAMLHYSPRVASSRPFPTTMRRTPTRRSDSARLYPVTHPHLARDRPSSSSSGGAPFFSARETPRASLVSSPCLLAPRRYGWVRIDGSRRV